MAFLHEGAPCGMSSLRSDTLTMRVTGVRITVFCSAIVIDVIVHCHTAGALLSQTAENNCPYHRVVGFLILSGQFIITPGVISRDSFDGGVLLEVDGHVMGGPGLNHRESMERLRWSN